MPKIKVLNNDKKDKDVVTHIIQNVPSHISDNDVFYRVQKTLPDMVALQIVESIPEQDA